jgi:cation diffusion facilitator family transporter
MDADSLERWRHDHAFLGAKHGTHERRTWAVVALTTVMMIAEIGGGAWLGSMALIADGLHMSTHVAALSIAALAYSIARRHVGNDWFSFGTGKLGELAAFASAIILAMVALLIGYESVTRFFHPVAIAFREAIPIAFVGLGVNLVSALLLHDDGHDHPHGHEDEAEFRDAHDHDNKHDHADDHDHAHHDHAHHDHAHHDHAHHADYNFRAAYIHVVADAVTSLLAITALGAAAYFGLPWLDPVAGLLGTVVIAVWAYSLIKSASAVLLDAVPSRARAGLIRQRLEIENDRVTDLHVWRLGPGHLGVVAVIVSEHPRSPDHYKARLAGIEGLSHVNIEVNPYTAAPADRVRSGAAMPTR